MLLCFRHGGVNSITHKIKPARCKNRAMYYRVACRYKDDMGMRVFISLLSPGAVCRIWFSQEGYKTAFHAAFQRIKEQQVQAEPHQTFY